MQNIFEISLSELLNIIEIIGIGVLLILVTLSKKYLSAYGSEKGKNAATKEDVEIITSKIESVKTELQYLTHKKISLFEEKQKSALKFYNFYSKWLNDVIYSNLVVPPEQLYVHINHVSRQRETQFQSILLSLANLEIYWRDDKELREEANALLKASFRLSDLSDKFLSSMMVECYDLDSFKESQKASPERLYKISMHQKNISELQKNYSVTKLELYKALAIKYHCFAKVLNNRISR